MPVIPALTTPTPSQPDARDAKLRQVAVDLEAAFLAEMLSYTGFGEARKDFGGGAGEEGFASLLRQEQAKSMAQAGGIGLAENIFNSLKARSDV